MNYITIKIIDIDDIECANQIFPLNKYAKVNYFSSDSQ